MTTSRCWGHLLFHWRFLVSWIIFALLAISAAHSEIGQNHPPLPSQSAASVKADATTASHRRTLTKQRRKSVRPQTEAVRQASRDPAPEWTPRSGWWIAKIAFIWGYVGWSLWWAMPATFGVVARAARRATDSWLLFTFGIPFIAAALLVSFVAGVFYSILGGGILHAGRCWWRLCHRANATVSHAGPTPQPVASLTDAQQVRAQLDRLETLLRQGLISNDEYTRRRKEIIDDATR